MTRVASGGRAAGTSPTMSDVETGTIRTAIPARLDRLPWSRFHWLVVIGLGTVWILDGLEVTIVGSIASRLTSHGSGIAMSGSQVGTAGAIYVLGACLGALFFGQLTDRFGRKKLFMITLAVYIAATGATAFAFAPWYFFLCRFLTGAGIGGEYAAINSAIDELIPARARGRVDLAINGSFWIGSIAASAVSILFLNTAIFAKDFGWRLEFAVGVILAFGILLVRRHVPESPRWLFIHGHEDEAERIVDGIEHEIAEDTGQKLEMPDKTIRVRQRRTISFREIGRVAFTAYPKRAVLGLCLFVGQAFIYNGITFNLGSLFATFFGVASATVPIFIMLYGVGNFLGPLTLGRLFDTVGRKPMIAGTYLGSALLTVPMAILFANGTIGKWPFEGFVCAVFFLASAGASAAYLTVSEVFPMESRALAIAFFYAVGTAAGGISGPLLFGNLIASGVRAQVELAFFIGAGVMAVGGIAEIFLGVPAEQTQLEDIAKPLSAEDAEEDGAASGEQPGGDEQSHPADALYARRQAEEARARAAEHRAAAHELRAAGSNGSAHERAELEERLGEIADLHARAFDERAEAREESADGQADEAGLARARAAELRATGYHERAAALGAGDETEARRHHELAEAAGERARAGEQCAAAALARADAGREEQPVEVAHARASVHESWAAMHEALGRAHLFRAKADQDSADAHEQDGRRLEERALAAEELVHAAEHRATASETERAQESGANGRQDAEAAERKRRQREVEGRARARLARRQARDRHGLRRFRPGPPARAVPAWMASTEFDDAADLDREIDAISRALDEHGPTGRRDLARLVGARYWGPGRFRAALREALEEGRARQLSRSTFGPPERAQH
jgi:MFS family permease